MQRWLEKDLVAWKSQTGRMPLLLRGARQVGKSYLLSHFGQMHFKNCVIINLELEPKFKSCFTTLKPQEIINCINALSFEKIEVGKSLLFLDEVQECPAAIMALRYFKEQLPQLHVVAAGSLLEFTLRQEQFRMPVGRIHSMYLKPLSFYEYIAAAGFSELIAAVKASDLQHPLELVYVEKLQDLLREYCIVGGCPAVAAHYINTQDLQYCQVLQASLLNTYRNDFGKYASQAKHKYLKKVFEKAPSLLARHIKYVDIDPNMQSRDLKSAIQDLSDAGLVHRVYNTNASGVPLNVNINEKKFKLLFLDVGLAKSSGQLSAALLLTENLMLVNQGVLMEQFVGQELLAYTPHYFSGELYYWERAKTGSSAEVDYVINVDDRIIPIEVKSGKTGRLRSLHQFIKEKQAPFGVRISMQPLSFQDQILSVPLTMVAELERLIRSKL